jgi:hypothetical protein
MKVVEYEIVNASSAHKLVAVMRELIVQGWQPIGGCSADDEYVYQAVVKYEDEQPIPRPAPPQRPTPNPPGRISSF